MTWRKSSFEGGTIHAPLPEPEIRFPEHEREDDDLLDRRKPDSDFVKRRRRVLRRRRIFLVLLSVVLGCLILIPVAVQGSGRRVTRITTPTTAQVAPPVYGQDLDEGLTQLATVYPGTYGIAVYDPSSGTEFGHNSDETFSTASLAKLPVMLTLYREAAAGRIDLDEEISIQPQDIQPYGAGVLKDYPVGYTMTLRECSELMIRESDNTAWVMLERRLGFPRISSELAVLGATDTDYAARLTTPDDVMTVLQAISDPTYTSPELSREMLASMTETAYEGRIPASLPDEARVAHKVGSWQSTFSDAGIVYRTDEDRDGYFIVVISSGTTEAVAERGIREISRSAFEEL